MRFNISQAIKGNERGFSSPALFWPQANEPSELMEARGEDAPRIVLASSCLFTYRVDNARNVARWLQELLKEEALLAARLPQGAEIE